MRAPLQRTQRAPPIPQAFFWSPLTQAFRSQHPVHEVALHTQAPPTHCWPSAHGGPAPQRHLPAEEQPSALTGSQATQAAPPVPQARSEGTRHRSPSQQPPGQLAHKLQVPDEHFRPGAQARHAAPPTPHALALSPGRQTFPSQQPSQLLRSQTHAPRTHRCPGPQAGPLPQRHSPVEAQVSAEAVSQGTHAEPPTPHAPTDGVRQAVPAQQPAMHDSPSQTHRPA